MNRWLLSLCLSLMTPVLGSADEPQVPGDPVTARFEQALAAQVDEVLEQRVDAASDRALALLQTREAARLGETARVAARKPVPERRGVVPVRLQCAGRGTGRAGGSC
jgi:hypothetical protein